MKDQNSGEPTNEERAAWAYQAVGEFVAAKCEMFDDDNIEQDAQDLITDILHLTKLRGFNVPRVLKWAVLNFEEESGSTGTVERD